MQCISAIIFNPSQDSMPGAIFRGIQEARCSVIPLLLNTAATEIDAAKLCGLCQGFIAIHPHGVGIGVVVPVLLMLVQAAMLESFHVPN